MPTYNDNNDINMSTIFHGEAMAQWGNLVLIDLRVAGSNPAGQLLIYFHNVFPVLTKTLCRHSNLVPRSRIKALVRKPRRCSRRPSAALVLIINYMILSSTKGLFSSSRFDSFQVCSINVFFVPDQ